MHRIFFNFLTREEQVNVLAQLQVKYPELEGQSLYNLIEALSDKFIQYTPAKKGLFGKIGFFFSSIGKMLGFVSRYGNDIDDFFYSVFNGYYKGDGNTDITAGMSMEKITRHFHGNPDYLMAAQQTLLTQISALYDFDTDITSEDVRQKKEMLKQKFKLVSPLTFDEAVEYTYDLLLERRDKYRLHLEKLQAKTDPTEKEQKEIPLWRELVQIHEILVGNHDSPTGTYKSAYKDLVKNLFPDVDVFEELGENSEAFTSDGTPKEMQDKEIVDLRKNINKQVKLILSTVQFKASPKVGAVVSYGGEGVEIADEYRITNVYRQGNDILLDLKEIVDYDPENKAKVIKGVNKNAIKEFKKPSFVEYNVAYNILLNTLLNLDLSQNLDQIIQYVDRSFEKYSAMPQGMAVAQKIKNIISRSFGELDENNKSKNKKWIEFYTDSELFVDLAGVADMRFIVPFDVRKNSSGTYLVLEKQKGENQSQFIERATNEINKALELFNFSEKPSNINVEELVYQYTLWRNRNNLAAINTSVASLREKRPMYGQREFHKGQR